MTALVDVLIPTYCRPTALAVTLVSLVGQGMTSFRVVISDQTEDADLLRVDEIRAVLRVLSVHGNELFLYRHLPRRGMAEHRQFLLDQARAPYVLFIDDDLILEPYVLEVMLQAIQEEQCGFVGNAVIGLSFRNDVRPAEQKIEFWDGPVQPEQIRPGTPNWERWRLHNAANLYHVAQRLGLDPRRPRRYRVAWVGGCVLYDVAKLRDAGGFDFWRELPAEHCGEDVLAQLRVMARYGGCGLIPSGVYHQELPTTIPDRRADAPKILEAIPGAGIYAGTGGLTTGYTG